VLEREPWLRSSDTAQNALIVAVVLSAPDDEATYVRSLEIVDDGCDAGCSRLELRDAVGSLTHVDRRSDGHHHDCVQHSPLLSVRLVVEVDACTVDAERSYRRANLGQVSSLDQDATRRAGYRVADLFRKFDLREVTPDVPRSSSLPTTTDHIPSGLPAAQLLPLLMRITEVAAHSVSRSATFADSSRSDASVRQNISSGSTRHRSPKWLTDQHRPAIDAWTMTNRTHGVHAKPNR
jgi:hypothetical protein